MSAWTEKIEKKKPSLPGRVINALESWLVSRFPARKSNMFLEGNFGPVPESGPLANLPLEGSLPAALDGEFVKNTPNPYFTPTRGYHWFDGDGMLHGVRIKDGKATYVARLVKTSRLKQEVAHGRAMFGKFGDMEGVFGLMNVLLIRPLRALLGVISTKEGEGTANTALIFHDRRLMALHEGDYPYIIRVLQDGELETLGRWSYENNLKHPFTAHPKVDAHTGEMFSFGYDLNGKFHVTYRRVSSEGQMSPPIAITVRKPTMMHDFAITEQYAIFMDLPLFFDPKAMVKENRVFMFDDKAPARFGILPRYADSEAAMKWFELPACFIFHTANAWEEGDDVVLFACRMPSITLTNTQQDYKPLDDFMYEFRFNMKTGEASQKEIANVNVDFPRINESFMGRKQRFVYCGRSEFLKISGIVKFDLTGTPVTLGPGQKDPVAAPGTAIAGFIPLGPGRFGGEPVFVPAGRDGSEDDGYLLTFVYDSAKDKSEMVVYDAKTMSAEPVASVLLPTRVPYGFHGLFVSEEQLQTQRTALNSA